MAKYKVPHFGPSGRPETMDITAADGLPHTGDLGVVYEEGTKRWQIAQLADAVNTAIGDVVYWKNYASYTATPTIGNSSRNEVAGIMEVIAGASTDFVALRQGGPMAVKSEAVVFARGDIAVAFTANNDVTVVAQGTAPTCRVVGVAQGAVAGGKVSLMLTIQPI